MDVHTHRILSLCSGVGMLDVGLKSGLEFLGIPSRVVGYCERDAYAQAVLLARMEDEALERAPMCDSLEDLDERWRGYVDWIVAGFPCQPWSHAGKQAGTDDERWLWPEIARVIRDVGPRFVLLENVPGLISGGGMEYVLSDFAALGFDAEWVRIPASSVGANHRRERVFILAYSTVGGFGELREPSRSDGQLNGGDRTVADADGAGRPQRGGITGDNGQELPGHERSSVPLFAPGPSDFDGWNRVVADGSFDFRAPAVKPGVRVLVDGVSLVLDASRADQLRCIGNSVVPLQAAAALIALIRRVTP